LYISNVEKEIVPSNILKMHLKSRKYTICTSNVYEVLTQWSEFSLTTSSDKVEIPSKLVVK